MCHTEYIWKNLQYSRQQLNVNLGGTFKNRINLQTLIMNLKESYFKGAKRIHIAQSEGAVAGYYMITNSSSTK